MLHRRKFLVSAAIWFAGTTSLTRASVIRDHMPWAPFPSSAPQAERPGPWQFFTADEASAIEAIVDRIIPPDPATPGGKDAGCAVLLIANCEDRTAPPPAFTPEGPSPKGRKSRGQNRL
jgi:gluconate 2-dehydrogenase gamma chain